MGSSVEQRPEEASFWWWSNLSPIVGICAGSGGNRAAGPRTGSGGRRALPVELSDELPAARAIFASAEAMTDPPGSEPGGAEPPLARLTAGLSFDAKLGPFGAVECVPSHDRCRPVGHHLFGGPDVRCQEHDELSTSFRLLAVTEEIPEQRQSGERLAGPG